MTSRLLEIGPRDDPAFYTPGTVFKEEDVAYFSIGLDRVPDVEASEYRRYQRGHVYRPIPLGSLATVAALPFRDASFQHVIMRSVIGEAWCDQPEGTTSSDEPSPLNGRSLNEALSGIAEVHRVLGPGGIIAIAEEDTPTPSKLIIDKLEEAEFTNVTLTPYSAWQFVDRYDSLLTMLGRVGQQPPDPEWVTARGKYWDKPQFSPQYSVEPWEYYPQASIYSSASYIVTAIKS